MTTTNHPRSSGEAISDEPAGMLFQHEETGRTTFVAMADAESFGGANERWFAVGPLYHRAALTPPAAPSAPFHFRRFVSGTKMAEDVCIEKAGSLDEAIKKAVSICPQSNAATVLVYLPAAPSVTAEAVKRAEPVAEHSDFYAKVCDLIGIGEAARSEGIAMVNISNALRRSRCLGGIENLFTFEVEVEDEEEESNLDQLLNWGQDCDAYVETFKAALHDPRVRALGVINDQPVAAVTMSHMGEILYRELKSYLPDWHEDEWDDLTPAYKRSYADVAITLAQRAGTGGSDVSVNRGDLQWILFVALDHDGDGSYKRLKAAAMGGETK